MTIICNYTYIYIYIYEHVQSDFAFVRTYMSAHTFMSAYMQEYVYYAQPKPCDCVGKSVPAALTAATYFVV